MDKKIKVLSVTPNKSGVGFFRCIRPHTYIDEFYGDEFEVSICEMINFNDPNWGVGFDLIHLHVACVNDYSSWEVKSKSLQRSGVKIIVDTDDYFMLNSSLPNHKAFNINVTPKIKTVLSNADYVTTTTPIYAKELLKLNKNVSVLPNAIDEREEQFKDKKTNSKKLRLGIICGSSHEKDIELLRGVSNMLKPDMDKLEFVLCGFDLRGDMIITDPKTGKQTSRPLLPSENVWTKYESIVTDNFSYVSEDYKKYLTSYIQNFEYPNVGNEHYVRRWTLEANKYGTHYNHVDILLVPLVNNTFNCMKSQLKVVESAFTGTNIIASNVGPYTIDLRSGYKKGGIIDYEANSILIDSNKTAKDWVKAIKTLLNDEKLRDSLKNNLRNEITEKYSLSKITKDRIELYKKCLGK